MRANSRSFGGWSDLACHARRQDPHLDLRRGRLAHRHDRLRRGGLPGGARRWPDRQIARPRGPAAHRQGRSRRREHGAPARRFVAGRLRASSPPVPVPDSSSFRHPFRSTAPPTSAAAAGNGGIEVLYHAGRRPHSSRSARNTAAPRPLVGSIAPAGHRKATTSGGPSSMPRPPTSIRGHRPAARRIVRHHRARFRHGARRALPRDALPGGPVKPGGTVRAEELAFLASPYAVEDWKGGGDPRLTRRDAAVADLG